MATHLLLDHALGSTLFKVTSKDHSVTDYSSVHSLLKPITILPIPDELLLKTYSVTKLYCDKSYKFKEIKTLSSDNLMRTAKLHFAKLNKINEDDLRVAERAKGHSFSKNKIEFSEEKEDNQIVQSVLFLEELNCECESWFSAISNEWQYFFPEMVNFCKKDEVLDLIGEIAEELLKENCELFGRDELARFFNQKNIDSTKNIQLYKKLEDAAVLSVGQKILRSDLLNILRLSRLLKAKFEAFKSIFAFLDKKMELVAPNLRNLLGPQMGAKIIAHTGGLSQLAMCPSSTIQVLGAETALFRALKTKQPTPKYGLIFPLLKGNEKGKKSRFLANKVAMCARIDCFGKSKGEFGLEMKLSWEKTCGKKNKKNENMEELLRRVAKKIENKDCEARKEK